MSYCDLAPGHPFHGPYHDREYGFPTRSEGKLFERLVLEINQAGLSWLTVLRKREAFAKSFDGFDVDRVASYGRRERERWRVCAMAERESPARQSAVGEAVQADLCIHRRRDYRRISDQHRLSARRA